MENNDFHGWLEEVKAALEEINMPYDAWQSAFPFDFAAAFKAGTPARDTALIANKHYWDEQDKVLPPHRRRRA
jgi:hypothetical protein